MSATRPAAPPGVSRPVLVLDADQPSALAIVRALSGHGVVVDVAASGPARPLASYSRHARSCSSYPSPLTDEAGFIAWMATRLQTQPGLLVIPVTERSLVPLMRHRAQFASGSIAMAPTAALEQALDKERTVQLAAALGIPVPRSVTVTDIGQLAAAAADFGFPVVVKPARSVGQDGHQRVQLSVSYAHDDAELMAQVRQALRYGAVILQEYFRGEGVGIELIADQGETRYTFQHRRLHEVPLTGGGSSLRVSEAVVPALQAASEQLMRAMGWHGVAMVEFKYAPATGAFRLMEVNGRFWGSLPLAIAAGANFPLMLHELMTTGRVCAHAPARPGVVCRQLARDIDWLEHVLRRAAPPQLVRLPGRAEVLRDCLLVFSPRHHFDVQSLRDPWPGMVDLWRIARKHWDRVRGMLQQRRLLRLAWRAGRPDGDARQALARAGRVLFLCYGNINRSALAQAYAQSHCPGRIVFTSAGFHAPAGRAADPMMVDVAASHGLDMSVWQSRTVDAQMVAEADVVFAMEVAHIERLQQAHPAARGKCFLLGAGDAPKASGVEIADPHGLHRRAYERAYQRVTAAVDAWFGRPAQTR